MICPDCGDEMTKTAIQHEDCSGWFVGWLCSCPDTHEKIALAIYSEKDWTAEIIEPLYQEEDK